LPGANVIKFIKIMIVKRVLALIVLSLRLIIV